MKNHTTITATAAVLALAATGCGEEAGTTEPVGTDQEAFTTYGAVKLARMLRTPMLSIRR